MTPQKYLPAKAMPDFKVERVDRTSWGGEEVTARAIQGQGPVVFADTLRPKATLRFQITNKNLLGKLVVGTVIPGVLPLLEDFLSGLL